ncbi:MAG: WG repeat-containing protein [Clostridia bacterium]|nr:WG repeat-containing protein [Clostridia bacterium]
MDNIIDELHNSEIQEFLTQYNINNELLRDLMQNKGFKDFIPFSAQAYYAKIDGKWAVVDSKTHEVVSSERYDEVSRLFGLVGFHYAWVERDGKRGLINEFGKEILAPKYDRIGIFKNGYAIVELNGKQGVINKDFEEVVKPIFDKTYNTDFSTIQFEKDGLFEFEYNGNKVWVTEDKWEGVFKNEQEVEAYHTMYNSMRDIRLQYFKEEISEKEYIDNVIEYRSDLAKEIYKMRIRENMKDQGKE